MVNVCTVRVEEIKKGKKEKGNKENLYDSIKGFKHFLRLVTLDSKQTFEIKGRRKITK
jgi:hypothetical protein